jgi:hypothetical protein
LSHSGIDVLHQIASNTRLIAPLARRHDSVASRSRLGGRRQRRKIPAGDGFRLGDYPTSSLASSSSSGTDMSPGSQT